MVEDTEARLSRFSNETLSRKNSEKKARCFAKNTGPTKTKTEREKIETCYKPSTNVPGGLLGKIRFFFGLPESGEKKARCSLPNIGHTKQN